jgi:hypothetical protein
MVADGGQTSVDPLPAIDEVPPLPPGLAAHAPAAQPPATQIVVRSPGTNGSAVASLIFSLLWLGGLGSLFGLILGAGAKQEIRRSGQSGDGLATAGVILGVIGILFAIPWWIAFAGIMNSGSY